MDVHLIWQTFYPPNQIEIALFDLGKYTDNKQNPEFATDNAGEEGACLGVVAGTNADIQGALVPVSSRRASETSKFPPQSCQALRDVLTMQVNHGLPIGGLQRTPLLQSVRNTVSVGQRVVRTGSNTIMHSRYIAAVPVRIRGIQLGFINHLVAITVVPLGEYLLGGARMRLLHSFVCGAALGTQVLRQCLVAGQVRLCCL